MEYKANRQRKNILWLASWYPNKEDHFTGDFIQRHAQSAALLNDIYVIHVVALNANASTSGETIQIKDGLTEHIIYYNQPKGLIGNFLKQATWFQLHLKAIHLYIKQNGLPKAVHLHVAWKAGLMALWLKWCYKLPYVVTEHWCMYNHVVVDNFFKKPFVVRQFIKKIFNESAHMATVSHSIANDIKGWMQRPNISLTPNVVNTKLFNLQSNKHTSFTFVHVSTLIPRKNVKGILNVFQSLSGHPFFNQMQLVIIGNKDDSYFQYAKSKGIEAKVFFKGEISYPEVAEEMKKCHCLIVNSLMENAPCVISEAHCCGLPVIATKVGGIPEMIDETNGVLIEPNNEESLAKGILNVFENYENYQQNEIAIASQQKYAYKTVAFQFDQIYTTL